MNILILISSLQIGGAEKQAVNDANMLSKEHQVYLVVFKDGPLKTRLFAEVSYKVFEKTNYIKASNQISEYILKNKIDLIHASLFAPMIIGVLSSIKTKIPVYWSFHSHEYDIPFKSRLAFRLLSRYRGLKKIFYVNKELKEFFEEKFKLPSKKSMVLYNTTDLKPREVFSKKESKEVIIGYVGRLISLKRVDYLIDLGMYLRENSIMNFQIHIYGDGETREELEKQSEEKQLQDYIFFHGFITELESAYRSFDIFVNPSQEECLSIATIDAGISGIPSIVFDVSGNNEIVINNKSGFIVGTEEEMFDSVKELIVDFDKRGKYGQYAIKHCSEMFTENSRNKVLNTIFLDEFQN